MSRSTDLEHSRLAIAKAFSTPGDPIQAIAEAVEQALAELGASWSDIIAVRHGTTIATNALLERRRS